MSDRASSPHEPELALRWTARLSLTGRILAVNIFVLALLSGGIFYLEGFRSRLVETRIEQIARETRVMAVALGDAPRAERGSLIVKFAHASGRRLRLYDGTGAPVADSFRLGPPSYRMVDPETEPLRKDIARAMDRFIDTLTATRIPPAVVDGPASTATNWPEIARSRSSGNDVSVYRLAPDRTPFISTARVVPGTGVVLLVTDNARDITRTVRSERLRLGLLFVATLIVSVLLSLFLARTIVRPLRRLMTAAIRVRWGRERDVTVPRLPGRNDEIGLLARAISDMTRSLRERIDAGEHFAADVAHELKNPISSLRSSIEALEAIDDPAVRSQLLAVARDDCRRLDRLVTDIAEASRMDAELSRAHFERVDIGSMIDAMVAAREARRTPDQPHIAYARPRKGSTDVMGDDNRLERVFDNLLDNALSFSPPGGVVRVSATRSGADVIVRVEDNGPGVAAQYRDAIFNRFYSLRPAGESFDRHSGLGLAIVQAIVAGHQGTVVVGDRDDGARGARFEVRLPAAGADAS
jgi:two-component system sensor histidine kinase ChvG